MQIGVGISTGESTFVRYMDTNATAQLSPVARVAIEEWLAVGRTANASSPHGWGRDSRAQVECTRRILAKTFAVGPRSVVFTSGATEGLQLAMRAARMTTGAAAPGLICDGLHSAARIPISKESREKAPTSIPFRADGSWNVDDLEGKDNTRFTGESWGVITLAQHESGVCFPLERFRRFAPRLPLVMDAAQAFGKIELNPASFGPGWVVVSGHKIGALSGVGAVIALGMEWPDAMLGDGQERGIRPGTEFGLGIHVFGKVVQSISHRLETYRQTQLEHVQLEKRVRQVSGVRVVAETSPRLPNTTLLLVADVEGDDLQEALYRLGFCVGTGAACNSHNKKPAPSLLEMGFSPSEIAGSCRISLEPGECPEAIEQLGMCLAEWIPRLRKGEFPKRPTSC